VGGLVRPKSDRALRALARSEACAHVFQTTSIGRSTPGRGRALASASIASPPPRQARPGVDPHGVVRPPPGSPDRAFDEECAWPHAGRPEPPPLIRTWYEKLPLCSVEQEVGVAARQQACGRGGRLGGAHDRLVMCEQPLVAEWRSDRQQRSFERGECIGCRAPRDPCPAAEPVSRRRAEDVEVAPSELAARVARVDLGSDDRPDSRRSRAVPADRDGARRRGVPERVPDAERAASLAIPSCARRRDGRATARPCAPPAHGPWRCREASPARTARSRA
jgi:hypothetical protein